MSAIDTHRSPGDRGGFLWGSRTYVMGIVNATPDSFSGDGTLSVAEAVQQGVRMSGQCGGIGLGRADIQPAIDQCRVHAHQLEREAFAQRTGQRRLARGGRAHQENGWRSGVGRHRAIVAAGLRGHRV